MILNVESRILNVKVPRAFGAADTQLRPQAQETPYILHPKFKILHLCVSILLGFLNETNAYTDELLV